MNENVNTLVQEIEGIDGMLNRLSDANNQIVDNISNLFCNNGRSDGLFRTGSGSVS